MTSALECFTQEGVVSSTCRSSYLNAGGPTCSGVECTDRRRDSFQDHCSCMHTIQKQMQQEVCEPPVQRPEQLQSQAQAEPPAQPPAAQPSSSAPRHTAKFAARRPDWELPQLHEGLHVDDDAVLFEKRGRQPCPSCQRSRYLYCYDCLVPLTQTPAVNLPFKFSIITHAEEMASKNTGVHAAILCPGSIQLHDVASCPEFDPARCVVLFPSDDALDVAQLEADSIDRAFIIDSKWQKAKLLIQHPSFACMRRVKLSNTKSSFWRFHTKGVTDEGVCTIEAMYFFLKALAEQGKLTHPMYRAEHYFDNLLWYFVHQHKVVQQAAAEKMERTKLRCEELGSEANANTRPQKSHKQQEQQGDSDREKKRKKGS